MKSRIDEAIKNGVLHTWRIHEREVRLCVKPCPRWVPVFIYKWFLKRLVIEDRNLPIYDFYDLEKPLSKSQKG